MDCHLADRVRCGNVSGGKEMSRSEIPSASKPDHSLLADAIELLRCPVTRQRLVLRGGAEEPHVSSEDGSVRHEIRNGMVLFVTGRRDGEPKPDDDKKR